MNRRWALLGLLGLGLGRAEASKRTMTIEGKDFEIIRVERDGSAHYTVYGRREVTEGYLYADVRIRLVRK